MALGMPFKDATGGYRAYKVLVSGSIMRGSLARHSSSATMRCAPKLGRPGGGQRKDQGIVRHKFLKVCVSTHVICSRPDPASVGLSGPAQSLS
jgi:hypothetical protein